MNKQHPALQHSRRVLFLRAFLLCLLLFSGMQAQRTWASPKLNTRKVYLPIGSTARLKVRGAKGASVTWTSANRKIVRVYSSGKLRALKAGKTTVTATVNGKKLTCIVRVQKLAIRQSSLTLDRGSSAALKVSKKNLTEAIVWSSSDPSVASVDENGTVTGLQDGTCTITAASGSMQDTCRIAVNSDRWQLLLDRYRSDTSVPALLFVKYTGGSNAQVELYTKAASQWSLSLSCSAYVGLNGIDKQAEGDKKTPTGTYHLTSGFGIAPDPGAKLPYVQVNSYLYWCGDSVCYNRLIDIREYPHSCSGEHLIDYTTCYQYGMFLDYNSSNVYGKGSAIFLHCFGSNPYTAGCIAVSQSNMIRLLQVMGEGSLICIYPA